MQSGSLVLCIRGHQGVIEEGSIYTVDHITEHYPTRIVGIHLCEVSPPSPHKGFKVDRFVEIQPPMDISKLLNEVMYENKD